MTAIEIRCDSGVMFFRLEDGVLEVKCRHPSCGVERGVVIIHRFSAVSGDLLETLKFRDPTPDRKEGEQDGHSGNVIAVRSA